MTQTQQEEVNLLKELIADSSISAEERDIYEGALSELMKSEKPKASTERKPRTTTQRKPQAPKQSKSDIESAKAEIKRRTGKTEEECESIVNEYRSLRAKSVERKKKETIASADNKDRVAKLKKDDKIISGTNEKTADAVIESTTKDVAEKIVKEIDKIEQKAEVEATKEVKKEMPKESTTEQNKVIAEKTEEKVKAQTKTIVKRIVIDTSSLLSSIAESLGKFDKDSQKEFLIKLRSDIDKLLTKYSYGGSTMGATQGYNITQSNLSSSSVNPTMFGGGGGVNRKFMAGGMNEDNEYYQVMDRNDAYFGMLGITQMGTSIDKSGKEYVTLNFDGKGINTFGMNQVKRVFNGGGGVGGNDNSLYLRSLTDTEQYVILKNIANHYDITQNKAYEEVTDIDSEALYEYVTDESLRMKIYNDMQRMAKGGKVYNRSWHQDHERFNKNEDYEIPLSSRKKKRFDEGGGVEKGYMVFNYTDDYYATDNVFTTKKEANNFIKEFRNRYKQQGYFRDNRMNKIAIEDIDLEIIPSDFNPFGKFNGGGGVDGDIKINDNITIKGNKVMVNGTNGFVNSGTINEWFEDSPKAVKEVLNDKDENGEILYKKIAESDNFMYYTLDFEDFNNADYKISDVLDYYAVHKASGRGGDWEIWNGLSFMPLQDEFRYGKLNYQHPSLKRLMQQDSYYKNKEKYADGGGVEEKEDYFFDEDDYENN